MILRYSILILGGLIGLLHSAGGQAGAFLRMGYGPRPMALGGAYTAQAQGALATYWNPAGLTYGSMTSLQISYALFPVDRQTGQFALSRAFSSWAIGFSWISFSVKNIQGRDSRGFPTGTFNYADHALLFTLAYCPLYLFSLGFSAKILFSGVQNSKALGMGEDIGFQFRSSRFAFGLVFQDFLALLRWNTPAHTQDTLPPTLRAGLTIPLFSSFYLSAELWKTRNQTPEYALGAEYHPHPLLGLRLGWHSLRGFSAGFGLRIGRLTFDYAYTQDPLVPSSPVHRMGLSLNYNPYDNFEPFKKGGVML